jgi:hypothetical protein
MTSFDGLFPTPSQQPQPKTDDQILFEDIQQSLSRGAWTPDVPEHRTLRELSRVYNYAPDPDIGFGGKLYNALAEETVIGQFTGDFFDPKFPSTGYSSTKEEKEYYAGDLPPELVERISDETDSFEQFLYELDQARLTLKRRQELYSGGALGIATGLGLTLATAGSEIIAATLLTGGIAGAIPGVSSLGANIATQSTRASRIVGAARAAGVALAVDVPIELARYRLDKTLTTNDLLIAIGAAGVLSTALGAAKPHLFINKLRDVSEDAAKREAADLARKTGDEEAAQAIEATMGKRDITIRDVAAPSREAFDKDVSRLADDQLEYRARQAGIKTTRTNAKRSIESALKTKEARELTELLVQRGKISNKTRLEALDKKIAEQVKPLAESTDFGIETVERIFQKADEKFRPELLQEMNPVSFAPVMTRSRGELEAALWKQQQSASREEVKKAVKEAQDVAAASIERNWDGLSDAQKRNTAKALGMPTEQLNSLTPAAMKRVTISLARKAIAKGSVRVSTVSRPTRIATTGAKLTYPAKTVKVFKRTVELKGNLEKMLFKIATTKKQEIVDTIADHLKARGVKDPVKLAQEFMKKVKADMVTQPRTKIYVADVADMELPSAARVLSTGSEFKPKKGQGLFEREKPFKMQADEDLFPGSTVRRDDPKITREEKAELDEPARSEVKEASMTNPSGEEIAVGDVRLVSVNAQALQRQASETATLTGHGQGVRETVSRSINQLGSSDGIGWFGLKWLANKFYRAFTPVYYRMNKSKSDLVRRWADAFMDNPLGRGAAGADAVARLNMEKAISTLQTGLRESKRMARKAGEVWDEAEIIRAVRSQADATGHVQLAVSHVRGFFKSIQKHAKEAGVFVEEVDAWKTYFPRRWNPAKFQQMVEKLGKGNKGAGIKKIEDLITDSILATPRAGGQAMTKGAARVAAKRIINFVDNPEVTRGHASQLKYLDSIRAEITTELQRLNETAIDVEDILEVIIPHFENQPHLTHGRRRILLDENFAASIDGVEVRLDDLMDMNLNLLTAQYAHKTLGAAAARQGMNAVFGNADLTISDVRERLIDAALKSGDTIEDANVFADFAEMSYKYTTGQPILTKQAMKYAQALNAISQGTIGMTLGFAQIPEIANIVFRNGFKAAFQQFKLGDIRNVFFMGLRGARTGGAEMLKDADDLSACIETFCGIGGDYHRLEHMLHRTDQLGFDDDFLTQTRWGRGLDAGRKFAALNPLGIMPMDTFMRRWASRASLQHFVNTAFETGADGAIKLSNSWWKRSKERFAQLGLDEDDVSRLSKVLKDPKRVVTEKGIFGNYKVKHFDFGGIEDQAIVDKFMIALRRSTDSAIQRQTFGELPAWTNTMLGKLLGQFRVFSIAAKSKQLAAGIARGDAMEVGNFIGGAGLAMLGYMSQAYYRSLGEQDPELYWAERTSEDQLIKSAFMRSGYSTILPMFTDLFATAFTGEGVFDESMRTTGLGLDPLHGSTAYSTVFRGLVPAIGGTTQALLRSDHDLTQTDLRNIQSVVWFTKIPGIDQLIRRYFIPQFPETNR